MAKSGAEVAEEFGRPAEVSRHLDSVPAAQLVGWGGAEEDRAQGGFVEGDGLGVVADRAVVTVGVPGPLQGGGISITSAISGPVRTWLSRRSVWSCR